jgi:hypothetical protein
MKKVKIIFIIVGVFALPFIFAYLVDTEGPFGEYMLYRKVKKGYIYHAKAYIERYPNGKYVKEIELLNSQSDFEGAKDEAIDTILSSTIDHCIKLFEFVKKFQNAPVNLEVMKIAEECVWLVCKFSSMGI